MKGFLGLILLIVTVTVLSCSVYGIGYTDENGQYVPRWPNFRLKDKPNNIVPLRLDTNNIYKMFEVYEDGVKIYPNVKPSFFSGSLVYMKFYPNGRVLRFSIPAEDGFGNPNQLKEEDLNPNKEYYSKDYYYSFDGRNIRIESFVNGDGSGMYVIVNYFLSETGDTIIRHDIVTGIKYKKEIIPPDWKKYKVDW